MHNEDVVKKGWIKKGNERIYGSSSLVILDRCELGKEVRSAS
jgi:hypothetical protein